MGTKQHGGCFEIHHTKPAFSQRKEAIGIGTGRIFDVPVEEGVTYNLTRTSHVHERDAAWSPDGKKIAWISDASGEFEIYIQTVGSDEAPKMLTKNTNNYIFSLLWSPDGSKLLWSTKRWI